MAYSPYPYHPPPRKPNNGAQILGAIITLAVIAWLINSYVFTFLPAGGDGASSPPAAAAPAATKCWLGDDPPCDAAFFQGDAPWGKMQYGDGSMSANGCAPAAMAMIITALKHERVTPDATAKYALSKDQYSYAPNGKGEGSKHTIAPILAEHWGLRAVKLAPSEADVKKSIADGGMVIMSGLERSPFTAEGHYIVIRAVNPDGTVMIGNSAGGTLRATNDQPQKLSDILYLNRNRKTSAYAIFR